MANSILFKGTRWQKCDFHLQTNLANNNNNQSLTAKGWVQTMLDRGLDCVAITDFNSGKMVDAIKLAAIGTQLTVFPGVKIICDTSKVHLLVLFDTEKTTDDVHDFLIRCHIERKRFGDEEEGTPLSIFEVAQIANDHNALIIPAHIDGFHGLGTISTSNLKSFFELPYVNTVQVVHKMFLEKDLQVEGDVELKKQLKDYYGKLYSSLDFTRIGNWHQAVHLAFDKNVTIATFSDAQTARFTWIKMGAKPTLESLRQAFLLPELRVKTDLVAPSPPYKMPNLWIKSISISNTTITNGEIPLKIDFSPQLTSIIGGRGSGKSSILRFIRGIFDKTSDLQSLEEIIADHKAFYKPVEQKTQKGVLTPKSKIVVEFVRNEVLHSITAQKIKASDQQEITIQKFDPASQKWFLEDADAYIDFFNFEQYSQKQIYEIAQAPNSLKERIDSSIPKIARLVKERKITRKSYLEKAALIRRMEQQIHGKGKINTEINDFNERIKLYKKSGIASLLSEKERFGSQEKAIQAFLAEIKGKEKKLEKIGRTIKLAMPNRTLFEGPHADEINGITKAVNQGYAEINEALVALQQKAEKLRSTYEAAIPTSRWKQDFNKNLNDFELQKAELEAKGIDDIANFEKLTVAKSEKEGELKDILEVEANLGAVKAEKARLRRSFFRKCKKISNLRQVYVANLLQNDKVKILIKPFQNIADFEYKLRTIIDRANYYANDIYTLSELCFSGEVEQKIKEVHDVFYKIRRGEKVDGVKKRFEELVKNMTEAQMDEIDLLIPEDEIDIQYKTSGADTYKPLSTASAGQKTTAILTIILSQGKIPLLLDQPEDDLDNRLVYELIVDRLRQVKEKRQIIVVTHNANIPLNGDAEYILSMNSESKKLAVYCEGTVENPIINKEICDVMEGSEKAFALRSKRYKQIL